MGPVQSLLIPWNRIHVKNGIAAFLPQWFLCVSPHGDVWLKGKFSIFSTILDPFTVIYSS